LFLRKGKWKNRQLVSEKWVNAVHQSSQAEKNYGYMWWINATQNWKGVSPGVFYAAGFGGNYIVVDQEHDLLVVTRWMDDTRIGEVFSLIVQSVTGK
jgi:CubicO group peptidase (beta-lactamase class C family)